MVGMRVVGGYARGLQCMHGFGLVYACPDPFSNTVLTHFGTPQASQKSCDCCWDTYTSGTGEHALLG